MSQRPATTAADANMMDYDYAAGRVMDVTPIGGPGDNGTPSMRSAPAPSDPTVSSRPSALRTSTYSSPSAGIDNNTSTRPATSAGMDNNTSTRPPATGNVARYYNNEKASGPPPRRWLTDRIRGKSKYGERERPWGPCCWVPPPVGWCPGLWEENGMCKLWGRVGAYKSEKSRFYCMHLGFLANLCGCILLAYSCFAISQDYSLLHKASFGSLILRERDGKFGENAEILVDIGLRAVALDNPVTGVDRVVVGFDTFCENANGGLQRYMNPEDCASCNDNSLNFVISAILAVISFLPTFFTDILRMFSGYDVNCQKFFGTFFSLLTVALALNVMFSWKFLCGDLFFKDEIYLDKDGSRVFSDDPTREYTMDHEYTWGWGMMTMIIGTCLKAFEALCHFCIPTPTVTRDRKEQEIYEVIKEEELA